MSRTRADVPARADGVNRDAFVRELKILGMYLAAAVGAGLVLWALRALLLAPRFGVRAAAALGTPWVMIAILLGACYFVQRFALRAVPTPGLGRSFTALALIIAAEFIAGLRF